jgi:PAS domain S-box-containing protein
MYKNNIYWARLVWGIVALVFTTDLMISRQYDIVFVYLLAHFLAIYFREKSDVLLLAVVTTTLTIVGAFLKPHEIPFEQMLLQRLPPMLSFWAAAFFVIRFIILRETEEQQEEKFKALFQYATNGILVTDQSGKIVLANPSILKLFGYERDELVGSPIEVLIPQSATHKHIRHREHFHEDPHPRSMGIGLDLKGRKRDNTEFSVEVSLSPFKSAGKAFVVAFVVDNTYRKSYENSILEQKEALKSMSTALQELNEGLENKVTERTAQLEAAKNEIATALEKERELGELKSRFVSMASHEFRTPLTSISTSAGLVSQYADRQDIEQVKKHANRIKNAVNGLNSILTDFLSIGRIEDGQIQVRWELHNVTDCVAAVLEQLRQILKNGQTFEHQHYGPPQAYMDANLCKNILLNLISNAIKYSPDNAPILIETTVTERLVRIGVRDKGIGIPLDEQKHLFDRFFRASNAINSTQGTGLGLYIVKRYADMLGGTVNFESSESGSVFWVEYPMPSK